MKILFILENYYPNIGGVETLFQNLAESLAFEGNEITVLTNRFSWKLPAKETINGVRVIRLPFFSRYLFTFFAIPFAIRHALKADLIHTTSYNAGVPAFFGGLFSRTKTIITFHEVWAKLWFRLPFFNIISKWLHYLFEQFLLRLPFHRFIAVSQSTFDKLVASNIPASKVKMIYNGIDYEKWKPRKINKDPHSKFRFIYFGRSGISKGLNLLIKALGILGRKRDDFMLTLIIPKHPLTFYNMILDIIKKHKAEPYINIKSDLSAEALKTEIQLADAAVIPSYSEGFCFTAVESIALGTPVITSGQGALKEVVSGKHLTMTEQNSINLSHYMNEALDNNWNYIPEKQFTLQRSVEAYIELYNDIIRS